MRLPTITTHRLGETTGDVRLTAGHGVDAIDLLEKIFPCLPDPVDSLKQAQHTLFNIVNPPPGMEIGDDCVFTAYEIHCLSLLDHDDDDDTAGTNDLWFQFWAIVQTGKIRQPKDGCLVQWTIGDCNIEDECNGQHQYTNLFAQDEQMSSDQTIHEMLKWPRSTEMIEYYDRTTTTSSIRIDSFARKFRAEAMVTAGWGKGEVYLMPYRSTVIEARADSMIVESCVQAGVHDRDAMISLAEAIINWEPKSSDPTPPSQVLLANIGSINRAIAQYPPKNRSGDLSASESDLRDQLREAHESITQMKDAFLEEMSDLREENRLLQMGDRAGDIAREQKRNDRLRRRIANLNDKLEDVEDLRYANKLLHNQVMARGDVIALLNRQLFETDQSLRRLRIKHEGAPVGIALAKPGPSTEELLTNPSLNGDS